MALDTPYLSEIALFSFGFAPQGWATCSGQLLPINQNQALFALLGTTYGGNGQTTFALPDLRGQVPLGFSDSAPGYSLGEKGGRETVSLTLATLPSHTHVIDTSALTATAACTNGPANQRTPVGGIPAAEAAGVTAVYSNAPPDGTMKAGAVPVAMTAGTAGDGQPHDNRQPFLALTYCIALQGTFPSPN